MNKKSSILFQITIFFSFIFIFINILVFIQFIISSNSYKSLEMKRYFSASKIIEKSYLEGLEENEINERISIFNVKISDISIYKLQLIYEKKIINFDEPTETYYYKNIKYIFFPHKRPPRMNKKSNFDRVPLPRRGAEFNPPPEILIIDELNEEMFKYFWLVILFVIDALLIWFFLFIRKKLLPLKKLKEEMIKFGKGDFSISTETTKKDEISQVANEFNNALKQLRELRESRNLFLRNIMHELKTPITKGKLIADIFDESERKTILIKIFYRLEYLLSEFTRIEELTSGKIILNKNEYRAIDTIEQAFDILLLDDNTIDIEIIDNLFLNIDFELFSIALKNLIDNALKYNTNGNPKILVTNKFISIKNKGNKLNKNINEYYKPFNHEYETSNEGLGLGLYITNNIIKIHNYELKYSYEEGYHHFLISVN